MTPTPPSENQLPGPRCPACGAPRIMSAAGPCYQCGVMLPPIAGDMPGVLGNAPLAHGLRTFRIVLGCLYLLLFAISLTLVVQWFWAPLLLAVFGFPCFIAAMNLYNTRARLGSPGGWQV